MPALNSEKDNFYIHIYNKSIDQGLLFKEDSDYRTFVSYLQEYLSAPVDPNQLKKSFSVKGRSYQGVPHQPKNYFNKVELAAFSLLPDHFHLIVRQIHNASVEKLIRSLATRYVIYFNKKYQRSGSLFAGPYRSMEIKEPTDLMLLSRYIHRESFRLKGNSSYKNFTGERVTAWIKPENILSSFTNTANSVFKSVKDYKSFVEDYELSPDENKILERLTFDRVGSRPIAEVPSQERQKFELTNVLTSESGSRHSKRVSEFITMSVLVFLILSGIGYRNIQISVNSTYYHKAEGPSPSPQVAGSETTQSTDDLPTPTPTISIEIIEELTSEKPNEITQTPETPLATDPVTKVESMDINLKVKREVVITATDGTVSVDIRKEPSNTAEVVSQAENGVTFELVSMKSDWYQILLTDGTGYVPVEFGYIQNRDN